MINGQQSLPSRLSHPPERGHESNHDAVHSVPWALTGWTDHGHGVSKAFPGPQMAWVQKITPTAVEKAKRERQATERPLYGYNRSRQRRK